MHIQIQEAKTRKKKPLDAELGFGRYFTDHMFIMDFEEGKGWYDARIVPYGPIQLDPAAMVLHYAQETFEGMKAYRTEDDRLLLFRPEMNAKRFAASNRRLCMEVMEEAMFVEAVEAIVRFEKDWVPKAPGTSLYIRPFMFATEAAIGVHPSKRYRFMIILTPVGSYYPQGMDPVRIYVEDMYVRAVKGGTGAAKCGGNYAASIAAQQKAAAHGYTQVLWLDGEQHRYVEEVGTMNAFFMIDDVMYTAPCDGSVLPGITRDSCIQLLRAWGYELKVERFTIDELMQAGHSGRLTEAFGTGTAAVISPIGELYYKGDTIPIHKGKTGPLTQRLYDTLTAIQWGRTEDVFRWTKEIF